MFAPLLNHGLAGYRSFLLRSAAALLPLENALQTAHVEAECPDWPARRRSSALRSDLANLGLIEPDHVPVPDMHDPAFLLGVLYVLEGSRLGAHVLLKDASRILPPQVATATRYLAHGRGQPLWPTFLQRLETSSVASQSLGETIAGARAAFGVFLASASAATHPQAPGAADA